MKSKQRVAILAAAVLGMPGAWAGWEYTATTKAEGQGAQQMNNTIKGVVDGERARFEFTTSGNPMMGTGTYLLTKDAGKTVTMVSPKDKTYMAWDLGALAGMAGAITKMQYLNPKVELLEETKGEKILGYATTRYRFRTSYTMSMNVMGFQNTTETVQEQEIWAAPALKDAAFNFKGLQGGMRVGDAALDKLLAAELGKIKGFPLKTVMTQTAKDARGKSSLTRMTMEVTSLNEVKPAVAQFEIPAGYTETTLFPKSGPAGGAGGGGAENPLLKLLQERRGK